MHVLPPYRRVLLLTEGRLGVFTSKTAAVLLGYRPNDVIAIVDSQAAGGRLPDVIPWAPALPIVPSVDATASMRPDALFIGVAPVGGALPPEMRQHVRAALARGIDIVSGLHAQLRHDAELAELAAEHGALIHDLRRPPDEQVVASARAREARCRRILTVGTDGNVGKMVTAFELARAASGRGFDARIAATGQTGIMVAGRGIAVDAVPADFAAGAAESLVLDAAAADVCIIEGQGSLSHPGFSAVTLALLHGACPHAMILVHHAGRERFRAEPHHPLPRVEALARAYERAADLVFPSHIVGVALNAAHVSTDVAAAERERLERALGVPVADPIHDGVEALLDAALRD